jgi:hypothetical protein
MPELGNGERKKPHCVPLVVDDQDASHMFFTNSCGHLTAI